MPDLSGASVKPIYLSVKCRLARRAISVMLKTQAKDCQVSCSLTFTNYCEPWSLSCAMHAIGWSKSKRLSTSVKRFWHLFVLSNVIGLVFNTFFQLGLRTFSTLVIIMFKDIYGGDARRGTTF